VSFYRPLTTALRALTFSTGLAKTKKSFSFSRILFMIRIIRNVPYITRLRSFRFTKWAAALLTFAFSLHAQVTSGPCTRRTSVVLSEIHYHPAGEAFANGEFIELYNSSPISVDLSDWKLGGDADFDFPEGTRLAGGQFLVIAADPSVLAEQGITALGPWTGTLTNGGGRVRLRKASGGIVLETNYEDSPRWPTAADGAGHSLILKYPSFGESRAAAWSASAHHGGSPGAFDPVSSDSLDQILISEILANSKVGEEDFVEFHNPTSSPLDLSGCFLSQSASFPGYLIPGGTTIAPGQYRAFTGNVGGFAFDATGGTIILRAPDAKRVLTSRRFTGQAEDRSWGGLTQWREFTRPTPGAPNAPEFRDQVVINEIHYHPVGGNNGGEFIEIFNAGINPVDLSGWELKDGIDFTFPAGTNLASRSSLAIARDRVTLLTLHPGLDPDSVLGDFSGSLANSSERIELEDLGNRIVDEVTYYDGGQWPPQADGGGSSLQLLDPDSDNALPSNWHAADESGSSQTVTIEHTGVLDFGHRATPQATRFFMMLHGPGEAIVENVEVLYNGQNLLANSSFDSGLEGWKLFGTHGPTFPQNGAMHLVATGEGDLANLVDTPLTAPIPPGATVTLRVTCRWISGDPDILLGLNGGFLEAGGTLPVPTATGTPASLNDNSGNSGPAITKISHSPLLPQPGEAITIRVRITDPDGIGSARLRYRIDPATSTSQIVMTDAGEGFYTATIAGQPNGAMVAFHILTIDAASPGVITRFPVDAPTRECLIKVGSNNEPGDLSTMHLWVTNDTLLEWRNRERSSNLELNATFVSEGRIFYNVGTYYAGSQNGVTIYDSPVGNPTGYNIKLPDDEFFLNGQNLTIDRETTRDATRQRERLLFWFLEKLKLPNLHRRYVHFYFNGVERDELIMESVQKPNRDVMDQWFEDKGRLTKTAPWWEFDGNSTVILAAGTERNLLRHLTTTDRSIKIPHHRWTWTQGAGHDDGNDFSGIIGLIDAAQAPTDQLVERMNEKADMRQWMRTFAMNDLGSYWDTFGNQANKNAYLFESLETGKWSVIIWDMDVGLGVFNDPVNDPLFHPNTEPNVRRLYAQPGIVRDYWAALQESLDTFFDASASSDIHDILQETYDVLLANDAAVTSPFVPSGNQGLAVDDWITQRRTFIQNELSGKDAGFAVSAPATSATRYVDLTGTNPLAATLISANGIALEPAYFTITSWTARLPLQPGMNEILVESFGQNGTPLGTDLLKIEYTGSDLWPDLKINEWMAANSAETGISDPADGNAEDWFELFNPDDMAVSLDGWHLSDDSGDPLKFAIPSGFLIPAGGHLLVWADDEIIQNNPTLRSEIHVPFKLSAAGESIILTAPDGRAIDRVDFAAQTSGIARLRRPDGSDQFTYTTSPTPATSNGTPPSITPVEITSFVTPSLVIVTFATTSGGIYELQTSPDLESWTTEGPPTFGDGKALTLSTSPAPGKQFLRIINH
jgi:hypothetical protein